MFRLMSVHCSCVESVFCKTEAGTIFKIQKYCHKTQVPRQVSNLLSDSN